MLLGAFERLVSLREIVKCTYNNNARVVCLLSQDSRAKKVLAAPLTHEHIFFYPSYIFSERERMLVRRISHDQVKVLYTSICPSFHHAKDTFALQNFFSLSLTIYLRKSQYLSCKEKFRLVSLDFPGAYTHLRPSLWASTYAGRYWERIPHPFPLLSMALTYTHTHTAGPPVIQRPCVAREKFLYFISTTTIDLNVCWRIFRTRACSTNSSRRI